MTRRKTKSKILEAVHETAKDLYEAGVIDRVTLREFDRLCLPAILFQRGYANEALEPILNASDQNDSM